MKHNKKDIENGVMLSRRCSASRCYATKQLDPEQKLLRMTRCGAFTLIELLVVVLIIGILAAIALPKYERAVMKSRYAGLKPVTRALANAEEAFYMARGTYDDSEDLANLDVQKPSDSNVSYEFSQTAGHDYVRASHNKLNNRYTQYLKRSKNFGGNIYCEASSSDTKAQQLCVAEGGTEVGAMNGYKLYLISGTSTGSFGYSLTSTSDIAGSDNVLGQSGVGPGHLYTYSDGENTITISANSCGSSGCSQRPAAESVPIRTCDAQNNCTTQQYYRPEVSPSDTSLKRTSEICTDYPFVCQ